VFPVSHDDFASSTEANTARSKRLVVETATVIKGMEIAIKLTELITSWNLLIETNQKRAQGDNSSFQADWKGIRRTKRGTAIHQSRNSNAGIICRLLSTRRENQKLFVGFASIPGTSGRAKPKYFHGRSSPVIAESHCHSQGISRQKYFQPGYSEKLSE
jgi:hypothetical protein